MMLITWWKCFFSLFFLVWIRGRVWMSYRKKYCVKTKVIALDWQWATLSSWCQMNCNGHSSPVKHKVESKPHKMLEKWKKKKPWKSTIVGHLFCEFITPILHTCLPLCWSYLCSTDGYLVVLLWFWVMRVKKQKTRASSWFQGKVSFYENLILTTFMKSIDIFKNGIHHFNLVNN